MKAKGKRQKAKGGRRVDRLLSSLLPFDFCLLPFAFSIFLIGVGVRVLVWQDARLEAGRVQTVVSENYKHVARLLWQGGVAAFFSPTSPLADFNTLGHPPGYSILLALIHHLRGGMDMDAGAQAFQISADAVAAVVTYLIAAELLPRRVAVVAGLLAALSPQFAWNSVLLLPDTLAALPLLVAVYCLVRAFKRPRLLTIFMAGALVGLSCWLRANALLLAPFIAVVIIPFLFERGRRLRYALALVCGMIFVVAPLTIRNAVVFHSFIPLSLGAGQTLLEGISDYDREGKFGIPSTDLAIIRGEAEAAGRPDYAETLFGPDGLKRERARMSRGFAVIAAHPLWFSTVMTRRALSMLRLERARQISPLPPVTHTLEVADETQPVWLSAPEELMRGGQILTANAVASLAPDTQNFMLACDDAKNAPQFASAPIALKENTDYIFQAPLTIERGRMTVSVMDENLRGLPLVSTVIETTEVKPADEQPRETIRLPFVNLKHARVRLLFSNAASDTPRPIVQIGEVKLFALGEAASLWTRFPRFLVAQLQKLFITALMLPLSILGGVLLWRAGERRTLLLMLAVPFYYFCVQSLLHTEYRYVLALHHFLFILAAVSFCRAGSILMSGTQKIIARVRGEGGESQSKSIASNQKVSAMKRITLSFLFILLIASTHDASAQQRQQQQQPATTPQSSNNSGGSGEVVDKMVAVINGTELITYTDLLWQLALQPNIPLDNPRQEDLKRALDLLIDQRLISQEAEKLPTAAPKPEAVEAELAQLIGFFPSKSDFYERLNRVGLGQDSEQLREIVRQRVAIKNYLDFRFRSFTVVSPQEIEAFYRDTYVPRFRKASPGRIVPKLEDASKEIQTELVESKIESDTDEFLEESRSNAEITILE